jgi:integrase
LANSDLATQRLDALTSQHAVSYAAKNKNFSASTVNCALRTLRQALNRAVEWGKLPAAAKISLAKGERQRERIVADEEFAAYLEQCEQPWQDVALLIHDEGIRPGEAYALRWEHVLLSDDGVSLILIVGGKSKAARRQLPMTPAVYTALKQRYDEQNRPETGWVFPSDSRSGHLEQGSAKNQHAKALRALETADPAFKRFEAYCLRHTSLTRLGEAGCDAWTLAKIAGHSSVAMTARYIHPQAEAIERAFHKLSAKSVRVGVTGGGGNRKFARSGARRSPSAIRNKERR